MFHFKHGSVLTEQHHVSQVARETAWYSLRFWQSCSEKDEVVYLFGLRRVKVRNLWWGGGQPGLHQISYVKINCFLTALPQSLKSWCGRENSNWVRLLTGMPGPREWAPPGAFKPCLELAAGALSQHALGYQLLMVQNGILDPDADCGPYRWVLLETRHGEEGVALLDEDAVWPHAMFWEQGSTAGCPSTSIPFQRLIQAPV